MLQLVTLRGQRVNSFFFLKKKKKNLLAERSGELDILLVNLNLSSSLIFGYQTFMYSLKAGSHMALSQERQILKIQARQEPLTRYSLANYRPHLTHFW